MSDNQEMISIIMAAYNAEKTIEYAVNSVLKQTYVNFELIVINDASNDNTKLFVERLAGSDKRIRLLNNETNCGVSYTRKHGLEAAKGDWIAILDSDDAWTPDKLEKQMKLQKRTKAKLLYTGSGFMNSAGEKMDWELKVPESLDYRTLLKQNLLSNSSALVRKSLYSRYYVSGDNLHEDFAVWLSILKTGVTAYGVNEPLLIYRLAKSSKSGNKLKAAKMNWNTYRYIGLRVPESIYYMCWYTAKGLRKYKNLRS